MITLKDIAKECHVSFSTVSKALKGSSEISAETIELIQQKAEQMGYHPNLAARTLRTNKTFDIGVIFEEKTGAGLQHQYFAKILSGLQQITQQKNYEITFSSHLNENNYDYYNHARSRNFDGVAVLSANFNNESIKKLVQSDIPAVTLDYFYDSKHTAVMSDNKTGMKELVEFVISKGHTKIAMIHGEDTFVTRERKKVFRETCEAHGISVPESYLAEGLYHNVLTSLEATNILLSQKEPPTCIFYPDDYSALGGIRELNSRNLIPGKDISIVGYDGIMLSSMMFPPLTTYEQDGEKIGQIIGAKLIENIENPEEYKNEHILVGGRILKGGTVISLS